MLSFKKHIKEAEAKAYGLDPKAGDEKRFKDKHVVAVTDYPSNNDDKDVQNMTKKSPAKKKRLADMDQDEAEKVYEEKMMKCEDCGEEYDADEGEHECEMDEETMTDSEVKKREEIVKGMKDKEADLKKRYGDRWKSVMYATATKKAMEEEKKNKTILVVNPKSDAAKKGGGVFRIPADQWPEYKKKGYSLAETVLDEAIAKSQMYALTKDKKIVAKGSKRDMERMQKKEGGTIYLSPSKKVGDMVESVKKEGQIDEAFKIGAMKLKDGSSVKLAKEDVQALDNLYKNLNSSNRKKMQEKLEADKKSFGEILAFAKQAM